MMKHLKKVLALVIVLTMSLSMVVSAGTIFPDVADDATYAEAAQILKSLNIMIGDENGNFNPDKVVTRAEMAKILCVITGKGDNIAPADSGFADATKAHWASGFIAAAKNAGYVNGKSETSFAPDDTVKWEEAVKLLMAALKYDQMAADNGGYPEGWIYAAGEAEVTGAGAAGTIGEECTRAKVAMLVYYALDADMMKQTVYSKDKEWIVAEGENLLNKYMDIYKVEGKVTNSYKLDSSLDEGFVDFTITKGDANVDYEKVLDATAKTEGGKTYYDVKNIDASGTIAADLLAYSSIAYIAKNDDDELSIAAIAAKGTKNKVTEIADMDLLYDAEKDSDERATRKPNFETAGSYRFSFWNDREADNAISYVKVDDNVVFVLNNEKPVKVADIIGEGFAGDKTAKVLEEITPVRGKIVMVDTDNDDYIDLFEIKSYEVAVVDTANESRQRIYFKSERTCTKNSYISLDKEENQSLKEVSITLDGKEIGLADLAENDVLTISTNDMKDPRYFDIIVSRNKVEGKVTGIKAADEKFFIGSDAYEVVEGISGLSFDDVAINDEGVFYLDADGYVALVDTVSKASNNYAYLDFIGEDYMGTVTTKLFTNEGAKLTVNAAEKVKINGVKVALKAAAVTEEEVEGTPTIVYPELTAMFGAAIAADIADEVGKDATFIDVIDAINNADVDLLGVDAKLNKFVTYKVSGEELTELDFACKKAADSKAFTFVDKATGVEWQADFNKFKSSKTLADSAKIFIIDGTIDDWKVVSPADLINENEYDPYFFGYQTDGTIGASVVFKSTTNINQNGSLAFFKDYRTGVYGEDDHDVYYVTYWTEGKLAEETIAIDSDAAAYDKVADMNIGDAFLFGVNGKGLVDELEVVFSPANAKNKGADAAIGTISAKLDEYMVLDDTKKLDNEIYFGLVAKSSNGRITLLDYADLSAVKGDATNGYYKALEFDNEKILTVPESAFVISYNAKASDAKKLAEATVADIVASSYLKTSTNGVKLPTNADGAIESDSEKDLAWAFVRLLNGEVKEVVAITYYNN